MRWSHSKCAGEVLLREAYDLCGLTVAVFRCDMILAAGYPIQRIPDYDGWLQRFETSLRALPERQRQHSLLPLLHKYQRPEKPIRGAMAPTDRFRAAVQDAKIGSDKDIPHITAPITINYIVNLQLLGLL